MFFISWVYHKLFTPLQQQPGLLTHFVTIEGLKNSKLRFETLNERGKNPTVIKNLEQSLYIEDNINKSIVLIFVSSKFWHFLSMPVLMLLMLFTYKINVLFFKCQIVVPSLPGKAWKRQMPFRGDDGIFEEDFIEDRRKGLEQFINK